MIFSLDIGIDLGTSNTALCVAGKGIIYHEPSVVASDISGGSKTVRTIGRNAEKMIGRTPGSVAAVKPLKDGVISDYTATTEMIRFLIRRAIGKSFFVSPRVMVSVPGGTTEVERRAVHMAVREAGARYVSLIESPMAAAIGAGVPVMNPKGSMVVDIGGGCTEVAITAMGDIISSASVKTGGDAMDNAIIDYFTQNYNLLIGSVTAENIKMKIGSAAPYDGEGTLTVHGRSLGDGLPKSMDVESSEIRVALMPCVNEITTLIRNTIEKTPPELVADILDGGIVLTGGGALLRGMDEAIHNEVQVPVKVAEDPVSCVIAGIEYCLENNDTRELA